VAEASPFACDARLADGTLVHLRPLLAADEAEFLRGFAALSRESRYRRFLDSVQKLTPEQITYLTNVDGKEHVAWIVSFDDEQGVERGAAVARSIRERDDPTIAEFAIAVTDAWQGRGVGRLLTETLARVAWNDGVRRWRATMLADNVPVQRCLARVAEEEERHAEDRGSIEAVYRLNVPADAPPSASTTA
jgi:GNAT superfamily N-acetyltransferase